MQTGAAAAAAAVHLPDYISPVDSEYPLMIPQCITCTKQESGLDCNYNLIYVQMYKSKQELWVSYLQSQLKKSFSWNVVFCCFVYGMPYFFLLSGLANQACC